ncbi:DUF3592 domain-containing protein, partial [bacterium]|nr:DUF3592 domain-containing protein [bacterium]
PMPLHDEGEVLFVSRRSLLIPTIIGAVFLAIGFWAVRTMAAKGGGWFMWVWGSIWFLGSGAALLSGLWGLLVSRPRFARLGDDGLQLYGPRAPILPWTQILEARLGPKKMKDHDGTTYVFRHPLILRLRDRSGFPTKGLKSHAFPMSPLPDGTLDWMVPLDGCPCDERDLLAKVQARLHPGTPLPATSAAPEPILPILGTRRLDRPHKPSVVTPIFALLFVGFGLFFAAKGVEADRKGADSLGWPTAKGTITQSQLERDSDGYSLRVRYVYRAQGKNLTGTRVAFAADSGQYPDWAKRFPPASIVDVHYNPADPADAVLVPGNAKSARRVIYFGLIFAAFGTWPIIAYYRARQRLERWLQENPDEPR